ncbi:chorismate-binding protein [Pukyongiella litopenaei]|nr:chorismate-binding protein [Pukyongiella litopenaei]
MTKITPQQRAACRLCVTENLPFALWREPGDDGFRMICGSGAPRVEPVFGGSGGQPAFVMAPFRTDDGNRAWHLPAEVLITADGARFWTGAGFSQTPVTPAQSRLAGGAEGGGIQAPATTVPVPEPVSAPDYEARVTRAVAAIHAGACDKIVLSRVDARDLPVGHDLCALADDLARVHPHAFVSLVSSQPTGTWLTATPEILLHADDTGLRTMALAGTQWPDPDSDPDTDPADLIWSDKIVEEQGFVAAFIRDAFAAEGIAGVSETPPATVRAANLYHLRSDFRAPAAPEPQLAGLLRRLHPTSAVCGMPRAGAHDFILAEEGDTRSFYTGYLGPKRVGAGTRLYVNLRSARVLRDRILLHVGGGIVAASDPALEWQETVEKTRTIGQVL